MNSQQCLGDYHFLLTVTPKLVCCIHKEVNPAFEVDAVLSPLILWEE